MLARIRAWWRNRPAARLKRIETVVLAVLKAQGNAQDTLEAHQKALEELANYHRPKIRINKDGPDRKFKPGPLGDTG